ncbi:hypothetical protein TWF718_004271 [Orbilia javanica]|uniref:Uncharacterized protein n=1 Tax=Orbilia javanica TaxID=47235 RepID=A0AAN8REW7_9PEZI
MGVEQRNKLPIISTDDPESTILGPEPTKHRPWDDLAPPKVPDKMEERKPIPGLEEHEKDFQERKALRREAIREGRDPLVEIWKRDRKKKQQKAQHD